MENLKWYNAFQRGEQWAFEFLYDRFQQPLLAFLSDRVGDVETAQDLLQETFLKVFRFRGFLKPKDEGGEPVLAQESLSGWIFQVARNTLYDWWRSAKHEASSVRLLEPLEDPRAPEGIHPIEMSERRSLVKVWLKTLTSPQRRVIWLWIVRGLSLEEISRQLGISLNAVKLLVHRSRAAALRI